AEPAPARLARHVDRKLTDPAVAGTRPVQARRRPGQHGAFVLDHDRRVARAAFGQRTLDVRRRALVGLERGHAVGDALVVDPRDRGGVGRRRLAYAGSDTLEPRPTSA